MTTAMKAKILINITAIFAIIFSFSSCTFTKKAYEGPKQNKASLAIVKGARIPNHYYPHETINITLIDSSFSSGNYPHSTPRQQLSILPGNHKVFIAHWQFPERGICYLLGYYLVTFDAEAGKTYIIKADTDYETSVVDVYVTDADSGERIASTVDYYYKLVDKE